MTDTDDEIEIEIERDEYVERAASDGHGGESEPSHEYASNDEYRGNGERAGSDDRDGYAHADGFDSPTRELEEELGRIDLETTPDGYVEGRVSALESVDETRVRLEVTLPHGERVEFLLEKPIPWSTEFLLARIVEDVGYDATSISHVVGERIPLKRIDLEDDVADGHDWKTTTVHAVGEVLLSSLGGRFHLAERRSPEWRLVDPLERRTLEDDDGGREITRGFGMLLVLSSPLIAAAGVATTGGIALSVPIVAAVFLSLVLALIGFSFVAGSRR
ncbi:hypothetical protein [Natrialba sp. INN-245]|uniref:hypothetical protein n=1 Tax=Natrialba sp. INN-245 TaxID=2690967 RepID=UPI00131130EC|nr:hypothetical protein [Natrialba sp. INN-245]MWV40336.1 hypothetical protein [Natrialba sp. INN-245]